MADHRHRKYIPQSSKIRITDITNNENKQITDIQQTDSINNTVRSKMP